MAEALNRSHPPASKPLDVAIVGGGIGGLSLLLGLLHHTSRDAIRPHIYESAAAFSEIGAGVGFGPNSTRAMQLVAPALFDAFTQAANAAETMWLDGKKVAVWNTLVMGMDGRTDRNALRAGEVFGKSWNLCWKKNIHRARFLDEMVRCLPGGTGEGFVSFRKRCVDVEDLGVGKGVRVLFADGTSVEADAVVGCDGVKSTVRQVLLKKIGDLDAVSPRFTGKYAYRGLVPMERAVELLGEKARFSQIICGYDAHLVCFPIDRGTTLNIVAFQTKEDGKWEHQDWIVNSTTERMLDDYKEWSEPVKELLRGLKNPVIWALFEHPPAKSYVDQEGKMCLLGDCAHASTPHQGAGAGMAIEDAAVLSRVLGALPKYDPESLQVALNAYDAVRRPRSQNLVRTSRDAGTLWEFQKEGILDDPNRIRENMQERMSWLWDVDMEGHCNDAVRIVKEAFPSA